MSWLAGVIERAKAASAAGPAPMRDGCVRRTALGMPLREDAVKRAAEAEGWQPDGEAGTPNLPPYPSTD